MTAKPYAEAAIASPQDNGLPTGRRFPIGITARVKTVVRMKENRNASFTPGHLERWSASIPERLPFGRLGLRIVQVSRGSTRRCSEHVNSLTNTIPPSAQRSQPVDM